MLLTFILNIRMRCGGSKLKKLEKCDFYAILNGKQLKKLLEVVTQNLKSFSNQNR